MVRNSKVFSPQYTIDSKANVKASEPQGKNAVVLTAIALLPELISVIKD